MTVVIHPSLDPIDHHCPECGQKLPVDLGQLAREHRVAAEEFVAAHRSYEWHIRMAEGYERQVASRNE